VNESFDQELSRAFKESTAKSLQGWEFTPAMRKQVMERIRQEEAGAPTPADPPVRKIRPAAVTRPLAWVAVAAAAVVLALQIDLSGVGFGSAKQEQKTASAPAAAKEAAPEDAMRSMDDKNPENSAAMAAPMAVAPPEVDARKMASIRVIALEAPAAEAAKMTGAAAPSEAYTLARAAANVDLAVPASGNAVTLSEDSLKVVTTSNSVAWERPMPAGSFVAVAADGAVAVGNNLSEIHLVSPDGQKEQVVQATAPIQNLAWSNDGRVAAAEGSLTVVYTARDGKQAYHVTSGLEADLAWAPDGSLATLGSQADGTRRLAVADRTGKVTFEANAEGRGVAFLQNGHMVVAGNGAFDRTGQLLWNLSMLPEGLIAVDPDTVAAWDGGRVMLVDVKSGFALWQASLEVGNSALRKVTASPDGKWLAIVAPDGNGGGLIWVIARDGTEFFR